MRLPITEAHRVKAREYTGPRGAVWLELGHGAQPDGMVTEGHAEIAYRAKVSRHTVARAVARLVDDGQLTRTKTPRTRPHRGHRPAVRVDLEQWRQFVAKLEEAE